MALIKDAYLQHSAYKTLGINDTQNNKTQPLCWVQLCLVSFFICCYAECQYDKRRYAECRGA
jgi:hypothetical protein